MSLLEPADFAELRRTGESLMVDRCRVLRLTQGALDPVTNQFPAPTESVVYDGPCRLQIKSDINTNIVEATVAGHEWTYLTGQLQLPVQGSENVRVDDVVEIYFTVFDQALVGRRFKLHGGYHKTHATMRRYRVLEVVA